MLFGMHLCDPTKGHLTIFEGEFDCLAGHQAGGINCVSVPSGMTGGMYEGDMNVRTGPRGEGKSTVLTQILLEVIEQGCNVCAYSGEIPADRFKYTVCLQAASGGFVKDFEDTQAQRVSQYVPNGILGDINRWLDGRFWLYDNRMVETNEAESVIRVFEQAYRRYNCRVFLVDNPMTVRTCRRDSDFYQLQADFMIRLRKLAESLGVTIHLVVHPRKVPRGVADNDDVGGLRTITCVRRVFGQAADGR